MVITNEIEWRRVWGIHTAGLADAPAAPAVDFSRQVVLALLMGEQQGADRSIEIAQIVRGPHETLAYFTLDGGAMQQSAVTSPATSQPFHFAVIERPASPLRFANSYGASCFTCVVP